MNGRTTRLTKAGILLVTGDAALRDTLVPALEAAQYDVLIAANADAAIRLAEVGRIDVLVMDVTAQPRHAWQSFVDLALLQPHVRILAITDPARRQTTAPDPAVGCLCLEKPFAPDQLVRRVNDLLAARRTETFRAELVRRHATPFLSAAPYRHWGLNE